MCTVRLLSANSRTVCDSSLSFYLLYLDSTFRFHLIQVLCLFYSVQFLDIFYYEKVNKSCHGMKLPNEPRLLSWQFSSNDLISLFLSEVSES